MLCRRQARQQDDVSRLIRRADAQGIPWCACLPEALSQRSPSSASPAISTARRPCDRSREREYTLLRPGRTQISSKVFQRRGAYFCPPPVSKGRAGRARFLVAMERKLDGGKPNSFQSMIAKRTGVMLAETSNLAAYIYDGPLPSLSAAAAGESDERILVYRTAEATVCGCGSRCARSEDHSLAGGDYQVSRH